MGVIKKHLWSNLTMSHFIIDELCIIFAILGFLVSYTEA